MNQPSRSAPHLHEECISDPRIRIEAGAWVQYRPAILMSSTLEALELCVNPRNPRYPPKHSMPNTLKTSHTPTEPNSFFNHASLPIHPPKLSSISADFVFWLAAVTGSSDTPTPFPPPSSEYLDGELDRQMDR